MLLYDEIYNYLTTYVCTGSLAITLSNVSCILIYCLIVYLFLLVANIVKRAFWR